MENYLVLNGQKIELTPEQYKEVCNAVSLKKSPFEKRGKDETYYYINSYGRISHGKEQGLCIDALLYAGANYCSNMKLMEKRSNYEVLERILWRFSEENGGAGVFSICYDNQTGDWETTVRTKNISMLGPTFCSKAIALGAIEEAKKWLRENGLKPEDVFF